MDTENTQIVKSEEEPQGEIRSATVIRPATDAVKETAAETAYRYYSESVASALAIDESAFLVLDNNGGIERKCLTEEQAMAFASDRVTRVGNVHTIFKRLAVVRPPRPVVEVDKD